jgi:hypothetical protein
MSLIPDSAVPAPVVSVDENGQDTKNWYEMTPSEPEYSARTMEAYRT